MSRYYLEFERPIHELQAKIKELRERAAILGMSEQLEEEIKLMEEKLQHLTIGVYQNLTPWQRVQIARHPQRPYPLDFIEQAFTDFEELHGDRRFADDHAIVGGIGKIEGRAVVVIGTQKGRDTKENIFRNFGCPHPEGYRKALRLMKLADKFDLPILTLVDTPGAYPGVGAEERHIAEAIAVNLREMFHFYVPIIATITGEGGSGGALGLAVADRLLILENAYYSVISPEGCAAILWRDRGAAPKAAEALKMTAQDLYQMGLVDEVVPEPLGGAHTDPEAAIHKWKELVLKHLDEVCKISPEQRIKMRYQKYRRIGYFKDGTATLIT